MSDDAAERLRAWIEYAAEQLRTSAVPRSDLLDAALTAERRATVERIRTAIMAAGEDHEYVIAILDAERDR